MWGGIRSWEFATSICVDEGYDVRTDLYAPVTEMGRGRILPVIPGEPACHELPQLPRPRG